MNLPEILDSRVSEDQACYRFLVSADLPCFSGHFPGHPVVPGVVQVQWACEVARRHFPETDCFCGLRNVKFHSLVVPGTRLCLEVRRFGERLGWRLLDDEDHEQVYSQGRMLFRSAE